jgi:hypothetical protein
VTIRPLPSHSLHRGGYIRCPGTAACSILTMPVPPQTKQRSCLMAGFILTMIPSYRSPGQHVEGGSLAEILLVRSATMWLRLYGYPRGAEQSLQRM